MDIFNGWSQFDGKREQYRQWKSLVETAFNPIINHQTTMRYCQALLIIRRNKIIDKAPSIIDDNKFAFTFENIFDQLDIAYLDDECEQCEQFCDSEQDIQRMHTNTPGNDEMNSLIIDEFSESKREELFLTKYKLDGQFESLRSFQKTKKIKRANKADRSNFNFSSIEFWVTQLFWERKASSDNESNLKRRMKCIKTTQSSSEVIFTNVKIIDSLIKRETRHIHYKYFRKKFIFFRVN